MQSKFRNLIQEKYNNKIQTKKYLSKVIFGKPLLQKISNAMNSQRNRTFRDIQEVLIENNINRDLISQFLQDELNIITFNSFLEVLKKEGYRQNIIKNIHDSYVDELIYTSLSEKLFLAAYDFISLDESLTLTDNTIIKLITCNDPITPGRLKVFDYILHVDCNKQYNSYKDINNFDEDMIDINSDTSVIYLMNFFSSISGQNITPKSFFRINSESSEIEKYNLIFPISFLLNYTTGDLKKIKTILTREITGTPSDEFSRKFIFLYKIHQLESAEDDIFLINNVSFNLKELSEQLHIFLKKIKNGTINY